MLRQSPVGLLLAHPDVETGGLDLAAVEPFQQGGKHGGGAVLTDEARQMLTAYDEYCEKLRAYGEKLFEETFAFYDDIPKQEVHKKEERYAR